MESQTSQEPETLELESLGVIWEQCFKKEICVKVPFDGKKCVKASGCIRILAQQNTYFLEIQLFGVRKRFNLLEQCIPAFTVGVASLEVCAKPERKPDGTVTGVKIDAKLCIRFGLKQCWKVIGTTVRFFHSADLLRTGHEAAEYPLLKSAFEEALMTGSEIVYIEESDDDFQPEEISRSCSDGEN